MPTYDYICEDCGYEFEQFQRMSEDLLTDCPSCHAASLRRKIGTGAGIIFKGGGFYETDFKDKKGGEAKGSKKNESSAPLSESGESSSEAKTESNSEAKPEVKSEPKIEKKAEVKKTDS